MSDELNLPTDVEAHTDAIARLLPSGRFTEAALVEGTRTRRVLEVAGYLLSLVSLKIHEVLNELDESKTLNLLERHERKWGITQSCIGIIGDLELRRKRLQAQFKLANASTTAELEEYLTLLGFNVTITTGADTYLMPYTTPHPTFATKQEILFVVVINAERNVVANLLPYETPHFTGVEGNNLLECVVNQLLPAYAYADFIYNETE